ncbi:hypothetical protein UY3_16962 [Chelonia mydas]|uniref:Uncharacterized protein n=1 Tax=Chelonia mydas TaxID=8469 RepID=M7ASS7_CHEMY|nr:hypothetical protein UY3_16962 [Chelonia mydas]
MENLISQARDRQPLARGPSGKSVGGPGWFVYLQHPQVQLIAALTGCSSLLQANGGCGKWQPAHPSAHAASHSPHWPGTVNRSQWELRLVKRADAAGTVQVQLSGSREVANEAFNGYVYTATRHPWLARTS